MSRESKAVRPGKEASTTNSTRHHLRRRSTKTRLVQTSYTRHCALCVDLHMGSSRICKLRTIFTLPPISRRIRSASRSRTRKLCSIWSSTSLRHRDVSLFLGEKHAGTRTCFVCLLSLVSARDADIVVTTNVWCARVLTQPIS